MAKATHDIESVTNGITPIESVHPRRLFLIAAADATPTEYVDPSQLFVEIASGGTGKVALLQHRQDPGIAESSTIKTLFLDTDSAELEEIPQEDKFLMTDYAADNHFQELADHPDRFPHQELAPSVDKFRAGLGRAKDISTGLMTHRVLGRPLLDYYATRMFAVLAAFFLMPVRALHAYASDACVRDFQGNIQERLRLTVCFVASICGGTGSSVGQLLQQFVDYLLTHQGGFTRFHLEADLFLPGALESEAQEPDLLRANTHAVLKENLKAVTEKLPPYRLGNVTLAQDLPPLYLYLFDNINVLGQVLESREQVTQMRNATWDLRCRGVSGREYRSQVVNIHLKAPAIYSAAGAAKMIYDVEHTLKIMGYRTGQVAAQTLIQPISAEAMAIAVDSWWSRLEHSIPDLMAVPAYQTTVAGAPLKLDVQPVVDEQPRNRVAVAVNQAIRRARDDWEEDFAALQRLTVATKEQLLIQQLTELLNTPGGFEVAQDVLAKLRATYERQYAELREQFDLRRPQHDRLRERLPEPASRWWQRWTWNPRGAYAKAYQRYVDSLLDLGRLQAQVETLAQMVEVINNLENQRQQLLATLSGLVERLERDSQTYLRHYHLYQSVAVHSVVCDDEVAAWYEEGADEARAQVLAGLKIAWLEDEEELGLLRSVEGIAEGKLAILSEEGIARHLAHAQLPWQHLRDLSVEELLLRKELSPLAVYAELERLSAPWVSLNDVKLVPAPKRLVILVSETDEFFHDLPTQPGVSVVASGNPYEMTLLTTLHGIDPLEHLTKSEDYERAYQQKLAEGHSLHLFPELFEDEVKGAEVNGTGDVQTPVKEVV